jgi:hypothetical protein
MCHVGPLSGAIVASLLWKRIKSIKVFWLTLLFWGGALLGVIDHLFNGELFLIPEDVAQDLSLGTIITVSILLVWGTVVFFARKNPVLRRVLEK